MSQDLSEMKHTVVRLSDDDEQSHTVIRINGSYCDTA